MNLKSMWESSKKAKTAAELTTILKAYTDFRASLDAKLLEHYERKSEVLSQGGPDALAAHLQVMRDIEDQMAVCDTAIEDHKKLVASAEKAEGKAKLEALAKKAAADAKLAEDLIRSAYRHGFEMLTARAQLQEIQARLHAFRKTAVAAGRPDLKPPGDTIAAAFAAKGWPFMDPLATPVANGFFSTVGHLRAQLEELGVKV